MSIRFRKRRNLQRGTEIGYATIPLKDVDSPDFYKEVELLLDRFYDSQGEGKPVEENDYKKNIGYYVNDIKNFVKSKSREKEYRFNLGPRKEDDNKSENRQKQYMFSMKKGARNLLIMQQPVVHGMFGGQSTINQTSFEGLQSILKKGFRSLNYDGNTKRKGHKNYRFNRGYYTTWGEEGNIKNGDVYSIELFPEEGQRVGIDYSVRKASADRISSVNIGLSKSASPEEKEKKMAFYQAEINGKYHVPVRFFVESADPENPKRVFPRREGIEHKISATAAILTLGTSIFLFSFGITGNVINNSLNQIPKNAIEISLFVIGLLATCFYFYRKR